jgi:TonB family protein
MRVMAGAIVALVLCGASGVVRAQGADAAQAPAGAPAKAESGVTPAKLVKTVHPVVQPAADGSSPVGTVVLSYRVLADGTVDNVQFVSGPAELKDAAIAAVKQWTYEPTLVSGHAVAADASVSLVIKARPAPISVESGGVKTTVYPGDAATAASVHLHADGEGADASASAQTDSTATPPAGLKRVRVGGDIAAANLIHQVPPEYPLDAKVHRVSGTVVLHALIAADGSVKDVKVVSGPDRLTDAAVDAVKQWRYKPTRINGQPVEVDTVISVVFKL